MTDIAGTTRDSIYTKYNKFGLNFYLVDTAGIRKKGKVNEDLEYYSVIRSIRAIENSDVCVLMLDATRGIESQDMNIFSLVQKNKKGLVVCVNKWDLVEDKSQKVIDTYTEAIRARLAPFTDFPILFISALTKQRILKVLETAKMVYENRSTRVSTAKLNEVMLPIIENYPPPAWKGKYLSSRSSILPSFRRVAYPLSSFSATCRSGSRIPISAFWRTRSGRTGLSLVHRSISLFERNRYNIL